MLTNSSQHSCDGNENKCDINGDNSNRYESKEYCYSPQTSQNFITIRRHLTQVVIPKRARERIQNVFEFMNKSTAMVHCYHHEVYFNNQASIIYNYDFHDKYSGKPLYCIADRVQNKRYLMRNRLYTHQDITKMRSESVSVPESCRPLYDVETVQNILASSISDVLNDTKWNKVRIYNAIWIPNKQCKKQYNTQRLTLSIVKTEFLRIITKATKIHLIPIIMFDEGEYRVEYVQILKICDSVNIGISYHKDSYNNMRVTGIHLNKARILKQHQLIAPNHDCHCLNGFESTIDDLRIGNPDDDLNRFKDLKQRSDKTIHELSLQIEQLQTQLEEEKRKEIKVVYSIIQLPAISAIPIISSFPAMQNINRPQPIQIPRNYNNNNGNTPLSFVFANTPHTNTSICNVNYGVNTATPTPNINVGAANGFPDTFTPHNQ